MGGHNHRELIATVAQAELAVPSVQEFVVPAEEDMIDVMEEERVIDVERTQ